MDREKRLAIEARLKALADANEGRLLPSAVVDDARNPESPLHDQFEWDDSRAAHAQRIATARSIIRSVRVDIIVHQRRISTVHYVHDPTTPREGYVRVASLRNEEGVARDALNAELRRVLAMLERARGIAGALSLTEDLDRAVQAIAVLQARAAEMAPTMEATP